MTEFDVAILGAGPAGLAAAYRLARAGHRPIVLERADHVGGMAASFTIAGVRVDHGSHRLHPACDPELMAVLRGFLGADLQRRRRHGRIRLAGRWVAFPPRAGDLVRHLPPTFAARLTRDAVTAPLRRPREDTFAEVVRAGLGPAMAREFYEPYVRKIWGVEPDALDGELARRRVGARSPTALLRKLARPGSRRNPDAGCFYYPRRGYGAVSDALADAARDAGADIRLGAEVQSLVSYASGWQVEVAGNEAIDAPRVWSTLPVPLLARLVRPAPPAPVLDAAGRLEFRALVLVYLVLERGRWTEFDAHYFPGADIVASRVSEPRNYRDDPEDPPDRTVLCAEVPCAMGDDVWDASPEQLGERLARELAGQGLPEVEPVAVETRRLPRAYPVYRTGFATDHRVVEDWLATRPALLTFGRQGLFAHDNTHHAMATAWAAADALRADGSFDEAAWRAARERFRSHVVED